MKIRVAESSDIPKIVQLLKLSLGDSLMPKSEEYWRWKHIDNPFGTSPVLIAEENGNIIGVRAFMRWEWKRGEEVLYAARAVDTATHPEFQGKGIFKRLTLEMVDYCKENGIDFIFNTPNEYSRPGYLKMGWSRVGKIPVSISIKKPVNLIFSLIKNARPTFLSDSEDLMLPDKCNFHNSDLWQTNYSHNYLKWRYSDIPIINYHSESYQSAYIIYRLKVGKMGRELRISDAFGHSSDLKVALKRLRKNQHYDFMSGKFYQDVKLPGVLKGSFSIGPDVTVKLVNRSTDDFSGFKQWAPTLGDLEVF